MGNNRDIPEADRELFRRSVGHVKPVRQDLAVTRRPRPVPEPLNTRAAAPAQTTGTTSGRTEPRASGEELLYWKPGLQQRVLRKLRRGQFAVERELDLHGMTSAMAKQAILRFLEECAAARCRCARIIHGKGRGSKDGKPVLKHRLDGWLRQQGRVLAFCTARHDDGGGGAVYVLIKDK